MAAYDGLGEERKERERQREKATLTVDIHTHILPSPEKMPNWKEAFGYGGFVQLQKSEGFLTI